MKPMDIFFLILLAIELSISIFTIKDNMNFGVTWISSPKKPVKMFMLRSSSWISTFIILLSFLISMVYVYIDQILWRLFAWPDFIIAAIPILLMILISIPLGCAITALIMYMGVRNKLYLTRMNP